MLPAHGVSGVLALLLLLYLLVALPTFLLATFQAHEADRHVDIASRDGPASISDWCQVDEPFGRNIQLRVKLRKLAPGFPPAVDIVGLHD
jgi:hypothetical protein